MPELEFLKEILVVSKGDNGLLVCFPVLRHRAHTKGNINCLLYVELPKQTFPFTPEFKRTIGKFERNVRRKVKDFSKRMFLSVGRKVNEELKKRGVPLSFYPLVDTFSVDVVGLWDISSARASDINEYEHCFDIRVSVFVDFLPDGVSPTDNTFKKLYEFAKITSKHDFNSLLFVVEKILREKFWALTVEKFRKVAAEEISILPTCSLKVNEWFHFMVKDLFGGPLDEVYFFPLPQEYGKRIVERVKLDPVVGLRELVTILAVTNTKERLGREEKFYFRISELVKFLEGEHLCQRRKDR